jgi:hypothetical protein
MVTHFNLRTDAGAMQEAARAVVEPTIQAIVDPLVVVKAEQPLVYDLIVRKWGTQELADALGRMMAYKLEGRRVMGAERRRRPRGTFSMPVATALMDIADIHEKKFGFPSNTTFSLI